MKIDLKAIRTKYEKELLESVIPFWENHAIDRDVGGFYTFLDEDGSRYDTMKYMWMQWRIVYMFATLHQSPYTKETWLDIAKEGFRFLTRHGKDKQDGLTKGQYYFALNGQGQPAIAPYNIYSECFACMASAALYKCTGDDLHKQEAQNAYQNFRERSQNPKGPWAKQLDGSTKYKSLGFHMMLANMGQVMQDCLGDDTYEKEIEESVDVVLNGFLDSSSKLIFENIKQNNDKDLSSVSGRMMNPGHGLESLWFILQYAEKKDRQDWIKMATESILSILEFSWDKEYGGLFYFMDALGKSPIELQWDMKLWWVHNEALIAVLFAFHLTGRKEFLEWFEKIDTWAWDHFPDHTNGEWYAYLNRRGEVTNRLKGGKWKTFFHLPRFLFVGGELLDKILLHQKTSFYVK